MNFIFVSPHFPNTYWNFCDRLHRNGVNVLGIGDAPFDEIPWELKQCLTEYYRVNDLGNYDEMLRAVAYFTFHYGKIDWIESNNEYWLEMDAQLRTDFNINTGAKNDFIERIKYKSKMKESYIAAGVPVARYHIVSTLAEARAFIKVRCWALQISFLKRGCTTTSKPTYRSRSKKSWPVDTFL